MQGTGVYAYRIAMRTVDKDSTHFRRMDDEAAYLAGKELLSLWHSVRAASDLAYQREDKHQSLYRCILHDSGQLSFLIQDWCQRFERNKFLEQNDLLNMQKVLNEWAHLLRMAEYIYDTEKEAAHGRRDNIG